MSAPVPKRISLLAQTVNSIRNQIYDGSWGQYLPPERTLCERLQISRSTLRRALEKVAAEGLIDLGGSGKRRTILAKPDPERARLPEEYTNTTHRIVWLSQTPLAEMSSINIRLIASLQARLAQRNCTLSIIQLPERVREKPERHMDRWMGDIEADAWILHWMPEPVQRWFHHHRRDACIFGTPADGIDLASIEFDTAAAMQHATIQLQHSGHTHIALLRPDNKLVGDQRMEERFLQLATDNIHHTAIRIGDEPEQIERELVRVFTKNDQRPPSALICTHVHSALYATTWLQHHRIKIPDQVSIILLRSQPLMRYVYPSLSHYAINEERAVTEIIPQLNDLMSAHISSSARINLIPEFKKGNSSR
ncbi:substrate-binding domain-containing protein [Sulfuriroseicoccus oceanibius]|uniref:Substrate-binding domain-containing protein n=1 Tax=Sulfuriroseicoccus oceanibius TaxID=2707525 RepID=A0A6B3LEJ7_9BACT|nr:substrate-binding domain-containing protein [Sulfuriroseicoccus oceanibius]QQL44939.1 substrate-binding domain-containing protein [Sulfuriroseicoccus oceanibius]